MKVYGGAGNISLADDILCGKSKFTFNASQITVCHALQLVSSLSNDIGSINNNITNSSTLHWPGMQHFIHHNIIINGFVVITNCRRRQLPFYTLAFRETLSLIPHIARRRTTAYCSSWAHHLREVALKCTSANPLTKSTGSNFYLLRLIWWLCADPALSSLGKLW